ncbi:MAG: RHS repeat-associated core domain-containing protein [Limisphaerales bacterium]
MREAGPAPIFVRLFAAAVGGALGARLDSRGCAFVLIFHTKTGISGAVVIAVEFGHRFYNSGDGRWLNRDPIGENGGLNVYGFVLNTPLNLSDVLGLDIWILKDCSGLIKHRWIVGTNPDGTYWSADFVPTADSYIRRVNCPGQINFTKNETVVTPGTSGYCIEEHLPGPPGDSKILKDLAKKLAADKSKYPRYRAGTYDCRHWACSIYNKGVNLQKLRKMFEEEKKRKKKGIHKRH